MKVNAILFAGFFTLISGHLWAGAVQPYIPVDIDEDNMSATGYMAATRYSKNDVEFIGCGVTVRDNGFTFGSCSAQDPDGNDAYCDIFDNEPLAKAVLGISDYSFISFGWNELNECTYIRVSHRSFYLPKK